MKLPRKKYKTIYADPPWMERGGGKIKRGADKHYPLMKTSEIMSLPIKNIAEDNSHLYLWVTNNYIEEGLKVIKAWGFRYITKIDWIKGEITENKLFRPDNLGLGQYFRGGSESCLFAVKGSLPYKKIEGKKQQGQTYIIAPRREHSRKPDEMRDMIEKVSYGDYIELFARQKTEGWDSWGNEVIE